MNPWKCTRHKKFYADASLPTGLRFRFEREVHPDIRALFLDFGRWLRGNYAFPMRVTVRVKTCGKVRLLNGSMAYGAFRWFGDFEPPYIRIPAGDYLERSAAVGSESAAEAILSSLVHELTHYFQWVNRIEQTDRSSEWQANYYRYRIIDLYMEQTGRSHLVG